MVKRLLCRVCAETSVQILCPNCCTVTAIMARTPAPVFSRQPRPLDGPLRRSEVGTICKQQGCGTRFFQSEASVKKFIDLYNVAGPTAAKGFWDGDEGLVECL